jgi:hypothetical protein
LDNFVQPTRLAISKQIIQLDKLVILSIRPVRSKAASVDGKLVIFPSRAYLRAELDAYCAPLCGLTRDELRYTLDPKDMYGDDPSPFDSAQGGSGQVFPGETFRVLKEEEMRQYGGYRTRRLVLTTWDRMFGA